jgi:ABC-type cobalamin/Fe3+-siderophores transport system ATPase subunit
MLRRFTYWEREKSGEEWQVEPLTFGKFNLIVGRNAAGKTRLLKAIARVAGEMSGELKTSTRAVKSEIEVDSGEELDWACRTQYLPFATAMDLKRQSEDVVERLNVASVYKLGFTKHGAAFEERILKQLEQIGYPMQQISLIEEPTFALEVLEKNRTRKTPFRRLSQAQQRSLTFITFLTFLDSESTEATVLVDDFAEGLDFDSARKLTRLVWEDFADSKLQFIVSSNDRYVMNTVPLEHLTVLAEEGDTTRVFNYANSKQKFDDFKFTGLSNFDFFSMEFTRAAE